MVFIYGAFINTPLVFLHIIINMLHQCCAGIYMVVLTFFIIFFLIYLTASIIVTGIVVLTVLPVSINNSSHTSDHFNFSRLCGISALQQSSADTGGAARFIATI